MNWQRKLVLISAVTGLISVFSPWIAISEDGFGTSIEHTINGFHGFGVLVFFAFAAVALLALTGGKFLNPLDKTMCLMLRSFGVIAMLALIISVANSPLTMESGIGLVEVGFGIGIWMAMLSATGVIASAWFFKSDQENFKHKPVNQNKRKHLIGLVVWQENDLDTQQSTPDEIDEHKEINY